MQALSRLLEELGIPSKIDSAFLHSFDMEPTQYWVPDGNGIEAYMHRTHSIDFCCKVPWFDETSPAREFEARRQYLDGKGLSAFLKHRSERPS